MVQRKARHPLKDEAERRFPHKVDVPVSGNGLGSDLTAWYFLEEADAEAFRQTWLTRHPS